MQIPTVLKKKVIRCFGAQGEEWLTKLPGLLEQCLEKWGLTDCRESEVLSFNYVCFASSRDYGNVAVKIGVPNWELNTEMTALKLYEGRNICRCHDQDVERGAMLLEQITPGHDLTTLADSRERILAAAELVAALPIPLSPDSGLPSWSDLARDTFGRLRTQNTAGEKMLRLADIAEELIGVLENSGRPKVLLHGDLNHWNILMGQDGRWKAIDPKGQAGVACMEAGRFMLNELEIAAPRDPVQLMDEMTAAFSAKLGEPRYIIAQVAFLDKALGTSWKFEEYGERDRSADVDECEFFLNYYLNCLEH